MNPLCVCCGWYCAFCMLIGIFFFSILISLEAGNSPYLGWVQQASGSSYADKTNECGYAIAVRITSLIFTYLHLLSSLSNIYGVER